MSETQGKCMVLTLWKGALRTVQHKHFYTDGDVDDIFTCEVYTQTVLKMRTPSCSVTESECEHHMRPYGPRFSMALYQLEVHTDQKIAKQEGRTVLNERPVISGNEEWIVQFCTPGWSNQLGMWRDEE